MTKIIKTDYTSGKEVITDVSDEVIHVVFCPETKKDKISFKIKRKHLLSLIVILKSYYEPI